MKITIIGASGLIGKQVVQKLRQQGQEVIAASRSSGVDVLTGEGLVGALVGAEVVVDVLNSPSWEDSAVLNFFDTSSRNLLAAEKAAGVKHHIALSVVGTDRMTESGYFRAKLAQEKRIKEGGVPYTIVRATQFFEFVNGIAQVSTEGQTIRLPHVFLQPLASEDVALALADIALKDPVNGIVEVAGPERIKLDDLVRQFLIATNDSRQVLTDDNAGYYGVKINDQSITPGDNPILASTRFVDWLQHSEKQLAPAR